MTKAAAPRDRVPRTCGSSDAASKKTATKTRTLSSSAGPRATARGPFARMASERASPPCPGTAAHAKSRSSNINRARSMATVL